MTLAQEITAQRERKRLTQKELAAASGVSRSTLCRIESGIIKRPDFACVVALADALALPLNKLAATVRRP